MESVRSGAKPGRGRLRGPPAPQLLQPLCEEQCQALTLHPASAAAARGPAAFLPASTLLGGVEASSSTGLPLPSHRRMQVFGQPCQDRCGASPSRTLWGAWSCSLPSLLWIPRALYAPGQSCIFINLLPDLFLEHLPGSPVESCISPAQIYLPRASGVGIEEDITPAIAG